MTTVAALGFISAWCRKHRPKSIPGGEKTSLGCTPQPCRDMRMVGPFRTCQVTCRSDKPVYYLSMGYTVYPQYHMQASPLGSVCSLWVLFSWEEQIWAHRWTGCEPPQRPQFSQYWPAGSPELRLPYTAWRESSGTGSCSPHDWEWLSDLVLAHWLVPTEQQHVCIELQALSNKCAH